MFDNSSIISLAENLADQYRNFLYIDPLTRIIFKTENIASPVKIEKSHDSALTWEVTLNPRQHSEAEDVKQSVTDALASIMLNELDFVEHASLSEARKRIECRLSLTLLKLLPDFEDLNGDYDD